MNEHTDITKDEDLDGKSVDEIIAKSTLPEDEVAGDDVAGDEITKDEIAEDKDPGSEAPEHTVDENEAADNTTPFQIPRSVSALRLGLALIGIVSAIFAALCAALAVSGNKADSKYIASSTEASLMIAFLIFGAIISVIALPIFKGERKVNIARAAAALSLLPAAASLYTAYVTFASSENIWKGIKLTENGKFEDFLQAFMPICAVVAAIFFILKLFSKCEVFKILCCIGIFALATLIIASLYLDLVIEINSHFKLALQFGAVAMILGTVADSRAFVSRISTGRFVCLKGLALMLCSLASAITLTAFASGYTVLPQHYLTYSILYAAYTVSVISELISVSLSQKAEQ